MAIVDRKTDLAVRIAAQASADEFHHTRALGYSFRERSDLSNDVIDDVLSFLVDEPVIPWRDF